MIRYSSSTAAIRILVETRHVRWQGKATQRTLLHRQAGKYIKKGEVLPDGKPAKEFWSEIKNVFLTIQYSKCIYCELHLERSAIQWDIEHFRPKDCVDAWSWSLPTGPGMANGYYLLAYDIENYALSCKVCNTICKRNYFPVANARVVDTETVVAHRVEHAYLLYPLGDNADDPEQHIVFDDVTAKAKNGSLRGQATIDLLQLNREELQIERADWLVNTFWSAYEGAAQGLVKPTTTLAYVLSNKAPHASCTRCYFQLCQTDPDEALRRYDKMYKILEDDDRV